MSAEHPQLGYVAHPVGAGPDRTANLARVRRWLRYLIARYPDLALVVPWLPYCDVLEEAPEHRARGLRDDRAVQRWCDAIVLVGGYLSPGMAEELAFAQEQGHDVIDLLHLGLEPPETDHDRTDAVGSDALEPGEVAG